MLIAPCPQVPALRDTLRALFSEPRLPDNPYYYLSHTLGAYVDQSPLWKETNDEHILSPYELEGSVTVVEPQTALCGHSGTSHCYGLPHIIRLVARDGQSLCMGHPGVCCHTPMRTPRLCRCTCCHLLCMPVCLAPCRTGCHHRPHWLHLQGWRH